MLANKLTGSGAAAKLYVDDVFSAHTYTGNGSTQTINNGIDLAGKGGMVWCKDRGAGNWHALIDTVRGVGKYSATNGIGAQFTDAQTLTAFNSTGFTLGADTSGFTNVSPNNYTSWTFRKAAKFFTQATVTVSGSNQTVDLSSLGTVGMVVVKRTDNTSSWYVFHRSATAGKLLYLEQTAAEATLGHITVSGTTLTLVQATIGNGTYIVYAWAHDTSTDGLIHCGSFTSDGSGNATVNLGWEPQFVIQKATADDNWRIYDTSRGLTGVAGSKPALQANTSVAEANNGGIAPTATGLSFSSQSASTSYIYLAIRRPNKPPTVGTQVYNAIARTGTGAAATVTGVGFAPDLVMSKERSLALYEPVWHDRLRGASKQLLSNSTAAEYSQADLVTAFNMDGVALGADAAFRDINYSAYTYINHFFKRAVGVFDVVCFSAPSGNANQRVAHNLSVVPELMIVRSRNPVSEVTCYWMTYVGSINNYLQLNATAGLATGANSWGTSPPTTTDFGINPAIAVYNYGENLVAYLFATKSGISKIGNYTGNGGTAGSAGTSQTIDCGFTTGSRFVMLKCTSHTSNWVVVDTVRGLIAGSDPALSLNTTAAEVTTTDLLDPDTSGFIVNQLATGTTSADFNVTGRTYIFLSFA